MPQRTPLYISVAETLADRIRSNEWEPGRRLPTEEILAKEFSVSRPTLRDAMSALEREGLITRRHGLGSFVADNQGRIIVGIERLASFTDTIRQAGRRASQVHLRSESVRLSHADAKRLSCVPGTNALRVRFLRLVDDVPVILTDDLIPAPFAPDVDEMNQLETLGLLGFFEQVRNTQVSHSLLAVRAVLADTEVGALLDLGVVHPLVELEGVAYDRAGHTLYATRTLIRSDRYELNLIRRR